jgi:hypothetical protein
MVSLRGDLVIKRSLRRRRRLWKANIKSVVKYVVNEVVMIRSVWSWTVPSGGIVCWWC